MKAILSTVFDMSLTASWVILAVLVIRFLLRKAPRKYSYALWSAAAFRLCCPVSFSSALSLFNLPLPAPTIRQPETVTHITQTPVQVIPTMPMTPIDPASPILPQLPATTPTTPTVTAPAVTPTVNTAEPWLTVAAVLWCIGMAALLVYAAASYVRLRQQLAAAIRLESNVYQAENIRSPFILGFLRPRIYIPYGLDADSLGYVLAHERTHLRRLDHIVKPLAFLLLTVHWFNPLVWLAFFLMSQDMEMSCDEAVLEREGNIRKSYSTTLLSFAVGRRFPAPSPLAFGETGVKRRIRNVLNWKKPAAWVTVMAILICAAVLIACAADPETPADSSTPDNTPAQSTAPDAPSLPDPVPAPTVGSYLSAKCLYLTPYSSKSYTGDSGYHYKIADWTMVITHRSSGEVLALSPDEWGWQEFPWTEQKWNALFMDSPINTPPEISGYTERLYQPLGEQYCLLQMDGILWIMETSTTTGDVWSIYALKPAAQSGSVQWEYAPYLSSRYPAFGFFIDLPDRYRLSAFCQSARLSARTDTSGSALQQQSVELSDGDILYWHPASPLSDGDEIHLTIQTPDNRLLEATLCIDLTSSGSDRALYTATLTGTDFVLTQPEDSWYATLSLSDQYAYTNIGEQTKFSVQVTSNGTVSAPFFRAVHSSRYQDGRWVEAAGRAFTPELLTEISSAIPTVTLGRDFRMDYAGEIYGPGQFALYDSQGKVIEDYQYYYGLTFLNWLDKGEYYLTFRISANGAYISSEDRYESTAWEGILRLSVPEKLAEPLPLGAKLELVSAEMRINGTAITVTDETSLNQLEKTLAKTKALPGGAGCPFGSVLYLTCADGTVYSLCHAEDSCSAIFVDGEYYQYSGDSSAVWSLFDPGSGSAPQPDTDKAAQLQLIADSVNLWALNPDYADDRVGYAVTDLDGNGRLEVISAQQGGTGSYTYASFYEVNDTCTALEKLPYDFPEGYSQPDLMDDETIPVFYGENTGTHTYVFRDWGKASAAEYWETVWALTPRNGEITTEPLATKATVYDSSGETSSYTDGSGNTITEKEYNDIAAASFPNHTRYEAAIHWLHFNRDESILSLDADTLLLKLKESCDNSGITEFLN